MHTGIGKGGGAWYYIMFNVNKTVIKIITSKFLTCQLFWKIPKQTFESDNLTIDGLLTVK